MTYHCCESKRALYRSRHGVIFGVCRGIADYLNISVFWTRAIAVACLLLSGLWPIVGIYLVAALLMKLEPVVPFVDDSDREFYSSYTASRRMALGRLKNTLESLDRRIQRVENVVTSREYDWERRLNS